MEKYIIMSRYDYWGPSGKEKSNWFVLDSTSYSKQGGEQRIAEIKQTFEYIDKKTKLEHEYKLVLKSEYIAEQNKLKKELAKAAKKQEEYYKSDEYKELQRKKRIAAKERKERQKQFNI